MEAVSYGRSRAGGRVHAFDGDKDMALCGTRIFQLTLVETPLPITVSCDWCRAELEKRRARKVQAA